MDLWDPARSALKGRLSVGGPSVVRTGSRKRLAFGRQAAKRKRKVPSHKQEHPVGCPFAKPPGQEYSRSNHLDREGDPQGKDLLTVNLCCFLAILVKPFSVPRDVPCADRYL